MPVNENAGTPFEDLIAAGLSPFAPETQNVRAGRLLLERIGELASERNLFRLYRPILDDWWLNNASSLPPKVIAAEERDRLTVKQKRPYCRIEQQPENDHEEIN